MGIQGQEEGQGRSSPHRRRLFRVGIQGQEEEPRRCLQATPPLPRGAAQSAPARRLRFRPLHRPHQFQRHGPGNARVHQRPDRPPGELPPSPRPIRESRLPQAPAHHRPSHREAGRDDCGSRQVPAKTRGGGIGRRPDAGGDELRPAQEPPHGPLPEPHRLLLLRRRHRAAPQEPFHGVLFNAPVEEAAQRAVQVVLADEGDVGVSPRATGTPGRASASGPPGPIPNAGIPHPSATGFPTPPDTGAA